MVPAHSHRIPRVLCYSGTPLSIVLFRLRGYYSLWQSFPAFFDYKTSHDVMWVRTPIINYNWFGLLPFRSPLLRQSLVYFLFLWVLRWFSSPGSPLHTMYSCTDNGALPPLCFHIQKSSDHRLFASPRRLSQLITSFIGA